jgi:hypothetical protein
VLALATAAQAQKIEGPNRLLVGYTLLARHCASPKNLSNSLATNSGCSSTTQ